MAPIRKLAYVPADPNTRNYRHGHKSAGGSPSPEYIAWNALRARCNNPNNPNYERYGARGIKVCEQWQNNFLQFLADMGPRPSGTSIERINNLGDYEPANCKWATQKEQCRNRRSSKFLEFRGEKKTSAEWSDITGISQGTLFSRIKSGWTTERALTEPLWANHGRGK